jgi:hypothetical protein
LDVPRGVVHPLKIRLALAAKSDHIGIQTVLATHKLGNRPFYGRNSSVRHLGGFVQVGFLKARR